MTECSLLGVKERYALELESERKLDTKINFRIKKDDYGCRNFGRKAHVCLAHLKDGTIPLESSLLYFSVE
jgi:hypothetical protein